MLQTNWITFIYIVKSLVIAVECPMINSNYEAKVFNMNIAKIIMFIAIEIQNQGAGNTNILLFKCLPI